MESNHTINSPGGELMIFYSQQEIKEFFSMIGLEPEELEEMGVYVKEEDDEFACDLESAHEYPVFDNSFYHNPVEERSSFLKRDSFTYDPDDITLDQDIYDKDYPVVAYVHFESTFDRQGDIKFKVFVIESMSLLWNMDRIKSMVDRNKVQWEKNFNERVEYEKKVQEYLKQKSMGSV